MTRHRRTRLFPPYRALPFAMPLRPLGCGSKQVEPETAGSSTSTMPSTGEKQDQPAPVEVKTPTAGAEPMVPRSSTGVVDDGEGGGGGRADEIGGRARASGGNEARGGTEEGDGNQPEDLAVYITVYPPPQSGAGPLVLEPLSGVELVMQVRQLLAEIPQTCIYSAFKLIAVTPAKAGAGDGGAEKEAGGSSSRRDVMRAPGDVMNDYAELKSIPAVVARPDKVQVSIGKGYLPWGGSYGPGFDKRWLLISSLM